MDALSKLADLAHRIRYLLVPAVLLFVALGFEFRFPATWLKELDQKVTGVELRMAEQEQKVAELRYIQQTENQTIVNRLNTLVRFQCIELPPRERALQPICDILGAP